MTWQIMTETKSSWQVNQSPWSLFKGGGKILWPTFISKVEGSAWLWIHQSKQGEGYMQVKMQMRVAHVHSRGLSTLACKRSKCWTTCWCRSSNGSLSTPLPQRLAACTCTQLRCCVPSGKQTYMKLLHCKSRSITWNMALWPFWWQWEPRIDPSWEIISKQEHCERLNAATNRSEQWYISGHTSAANNALTKSILRGNQ